MPSWGVQITARAVVEASKRQTLVVGHRGAAGEALENTVAAFEAGIASGAVAIECDVWISRDGVPVVMHDESPARTFPALAAPVADYSADEFRTAGVATLEEYLDIVRGRAVAIVELKGGDAVVARTLERVRAAGMLEATILFSFCAGYLAEAKELEPAAFTVLLQGNADEIADRARAVDAVGLHHASVNEAVFRLGKPVFAWTVAPGPEVTRLQSLGTNFLITDYPSVVFAQLT